MREENSWLLEECKWYSNCGVEVQGEPVVRYVNGIPYIKRLSGHL
jgi:hypothetical protein